jgi:4-amino-4-deoxy-L-arabinose transferase-like glycosyltransferase
MNTPESNEEALRQTIIAGLADLSVEELKEVAAAVAHLQQDRETTDASSLGSPWFERHSQTFPKVSNLISSKRPSTQYVSTFLLIVLVILSLAIRFMPARFRVDLWPWPDTPEYVTAASRLLQYGKFDIVANHLEVPTRYSLGYPLLIIPAYLVFGPSPENAIYVSLLMGLLEILLAFWIAWRLFGSAAALVAASIVSLSPANVFLSQQMMSDLPASVFVLASMLALTFLAPAPQAGKTGNSRRVWPYIALAGGLFGYACLIRQTSVLYLPVYLLYLALAIWRPRLRFSTLLHETVKGSLPFIAAWLAFQLPILIYNQLVFGNPFRTGYHYWLPYWYGENPTFSLRYAFEAPANLSSYFAGIIGQPILHMYRGPLVLYSPLVAAAALAGLLVIFARFYSLVRGRGRLLSNDSARKAERYALARFAFAAGCVGILAVTLATYSLYFFEADARFVELFVPLIAVLAGSFVAEAMSSGKGIAGYRLPPPWRSLLYVVLTVVAGVGLISALVESYAWKTFVTREYDYDSYAYQSSNDAEYMRVLSRLSAQSGDVLISDKYPTVFFEVYHPEMDLFAISTAISKSISFSPGSDPHPVRSLEGTPSAVADKLAAGRQVFFIGDPNEFEAIVSRDRLPFTLIPIETPTARTGLVLYRVAMNADISA